MKKFIILLIVVFTACITKNSNAQFVLLQDATGGNVISANGYVDVEGSPFFVQDWAKATVTLFTGRVINNLDIKYDNVKDDVYVKGPNEEVVLLNDRIKSFNYTAGFGEFNSGYENIPGYDAKAYFQVLSSGKTKLLKKYTKIIQTDKPYNSAVSTKTFVETTKYYIVSPSSAIQVKKDKKTILAALADKQPQVETYIKENNLNLKSDIDIAKLVTYYNTL